jgi:hypothetical protein
MNRAPRIGLFCKDNKLALAGANAILMLLAAFSLVPPN